MARFVNAPLGKLRGALGDLADGGTDVLHHQVHVVAQLAVGAGVLRFDRLGKHVRLEQERIGYARLRKVLGKLVG